MPPRGIDIRAISTEDRAAVLEIARELVRAADTYAFDRSVSDDDLWRYWSPDLPGRGYVSTVDGQAAGVFVIRPNHPGPGAHVANASYAVRAEARGQGLGRRMGEASVDIARDLGYRALQFNIVVDSNRGAIHLWQSLGFRIVGTIPKGFRLPDGRLVAHHIMFREL